MFIWPSGSYGIPSLNISFAALYFFRCCSARTEALLKSSSEIILWHVNTLLKERVDTENECLGMVSLDEEVIEDERKDKAEPQKAHPTGLLLWHKMVAVHCFVWPLALRLWSVRQSD